MNYRGVLLFEKLGLGSARRDVKASHFFLIKSREIPSPLLFRCGKGARWPSLFCCFRFGSVGLFALPFFFH